MNAVSTNVLQPAGREPRKVGSGMGKEEGVDREGGGKVEVEGGGGWIVRGGGFGCG